MTDFYTSNIGIKNLKKNNFEKMVCTYSIKAQKKEYVWFIYERVITNKITGLYLYNKTDAKEETNGLMINDMLKILYAYMCLCTPEFKREITDRKNKCEAIYLINKLNIDKLKKELNNLKEDIPSFVYDEIVKIIGFMVVMNERELIILDFMKEYCGITKSISEENKKIVSSKILLEFYNGLYDYSNSVNAINKYVEQQNEICKKCKDYFSVLPQKIQYIKFEDLINYQLNNYFQFIFHSKGSLISLLIEKGFSESIIEPYQKLIRNTLDTSLD